MNRISLWRISATTKYKCRHLISLKLHPDSHSGGAVLWQNLNQPDSHHGGAVSQRILNAELVIKLKLKHRTSAPYKASEMIYKQRFSFKMSWDTAPELKR